MRITRKAVLTATAVTASAFLAGCSDSATEPKPVSATVGKPSLAVAGTVVNSTPVASEFRVCKLGNTAGTFTVTRTNAGTGSTGFTIVSSPITIQPNTCVVVVEDDSPSNAGSNVTVTETNASNLTSITGQRISTVTGTTTIASPTNPFTDFINSIHGVVLTFTNTVTPVTTGCTFTKGWYRNKGSSTIIAVDGRTIAQEQAIFDATPGKPGGVTFGDDNTLLNLYQQLLAALNNLGGNPTAGPAAVDAAVAAAIAGTGGTGLNITTTLTHDQMSDLIDVLSAFNEGSFTGWPHCDD
jgi:hypothetical protein